MHTKSLAVPVFTAALVAALAGCSTASPKPGPAAGSSGSSSKVIQVVAAENFWGSIAEQLGGKQVKVTNIIKSPDADPHDYEATAADGRSIASADLTLINGIGYDTWATKLAAANPNPARTELTVGPLVGLAAGDNPHSWYSPGDVQKVVDQIVADYKKIDPTDSAYFDSQKKAFETNATSDYKAAIADIKRKYAGTPVGVSESIFEKVNPALGLRLLTPPGFMKAISEGTDPTAADKATIDSQIKNKQIKVYVFNAQNATPDVQRQVDEATAQGIPVTVITETMTPATASWQHWQTAQLVALGNALAEATGR